MQELLKNRKLLEIQFAGEHFTSETNKGYYTKDINGKDFDLSSLKKSKYSVTEPVAKKIFFFPTKKER